MNINPKIENLKQVKIDLTGYFISAKALEVLRLALIGLRTDSKYQFELYPVQAVYNGVKEDSFFVKVNVGQPGLGTKLVEIANAFGEESILSSLKNTYIVPTDNAAQVKELTLDKNEVLHSTDLTEVKGDHSLIDIGGGWYQLVKFNSVK